MWLMSRDFKVGHYPCLTSRQWKLFPAPSPCMVLGANVNVIVIELEIETIDMELKASMDH